MRDYFIPTHGGFLFFYIEKLEFAARNFISNTNGTNRRSTTDSGVNYTNFCADALFFVTQIARIAQKFAAGGYNCNFSFLYEPPLHKTPHFPISRAFDGIWCAMLNVAILT